LVITNDYPPRPGGIQTFIFEMVRRFPADQVTVLTSNFEGAQEFDASNPWNVLRSEAQVLLPTRNTLELAQELIDETGATQVLFGAAAPLGLLAKNLRKSGISNIVSISHGHEVGWSSTPVTHQGIRRIVADSDWFTYLGEYTLAGIRKAANPEDFVKFRQLTPAVDANEFHPDQKIAGNTLRASIGFAHRPTIVCVSRLMARKGQDRLIEALPLVQQQVPGAALIIVGSGSGLKKLQDHAVRVGVADDVHFTGKVPQQQLASWYAAGDIFAMPCRTRNAGWDVEGLGIVFLEASATGLAVVAGDSGGAPDAVRDGETGIVVDGNDLDQIAGSISELLLNPERAEAMGQAGRLWVEQAWTWEHSFSRLSSMLSGTDPDA
jgi:phosphatidylinositol alpha-1,6-mannosyltransferase